MSAAVPSLSMSQKPSQINTGSPRSAIRPHPAGLATRGRGLAHLVSRFEILDAISDSDCSTAPEPQASFKNGNKLALRDPDGKPKPSLSVASPRSAVTLSSTSRNTIVDSSGRLSRYVPSPGASSHSSPARDPASGAGRKSMVAERRKFFEGRPPNSSMDGLPGPPRSSPVPTTHQFSPGSSTSTSWHNLDRSSRRLPLDSSWQVMQVVSPSPSSTSNRTILQETVSTRNVWNRRSIYLPLTKTCPSFLDTQRNKADIRVPQGASDLPTREDDVPEPASESALAYPPGSGDTRDKFSWPPLKQDQLLVDHSTASRMPVPSQDDAMTVKPPTVNLTPSSAKSSGTIRIISDGELLSDPKLSKTIIQMTPSNVSEMDDSPIRGAPASYQSVQTTGHQTSAVQPCYREIEARRHEQSGKEQMKSNGEFAENRASEPTIHPAGRKAPRLEDTIGLFESLSRLQVTRESVSRGGPQPAHKGPSEGATRNREPRLQRKLSGLESTMRKLSGSWNKTRLARVMSRQLGSGDKETKIGKDPPSTLFGKDETLSGLHEDDSEMSLIAAVTVTGSSLPRIREPFCETFSGPWDRRSNGSDSTDASHSEATDDDGNPLAQDGRLQARRIHRDADSKAASLDDDDDDGAHGAWRGRRRWVSRSSGTLVARAQCSLEQPRPVRANEVKRLVSLCRDKVSGWKSRGHSE